MRHQASGLDAGDGYSNVITDRLVSLRPENLLAEGVPAFDRDPSKSFPRDLPSADAFVSTSTRPREKGRRAKGSAPRPWDSTPNPRSSTTRVPFIENLFS